MPSDYPGGLERDSQLRSAVKRLFQKTNKQIIMESASVALKMYKGEDMPTGVLPPERREQFRIDYADSFGGFDLLEFERRGEAYVDSFMRSKGKDPAKD